MISKLLVILKKNWEKYQGMPLKTCLKIMLLKNNNENTK